jgi:hypothetical protein
LLETSNSLQVVPIEWMRSTSDTFIGRMTIIPP